MNVTCEDLLDYFRGPGPCGWCGFKCRDRRDPDHVFPKGSGSRLDIPANIISLGYDLACGCHYRKHYQNRDPSRDDLIGKVAERYKTTPDAIKSEIFRALNQLPKGSVYECPFTGFVWSSHGEVHLPGLQKIFPDIPNARRQVPEARQDLV